VRAPWRQLARNWEAPLLALLLAAVGWLTYSSFTASHRTEHVRALLGQFTSADAQFSAAILEARMASYANYDHANNLLAEMRTLRAQLAEGPDAIGGRGNAAIDRELDALARGLDVKAGELDRFTRDNATTKNSIHFFPWGIHDLIESGRRDPAIPVAALSMLSHTMLLYLGPLDDRDPATLDRWIAELKQQRAFLTSASARRLDLVLRHAQVIRDVLPRLDATTRALTTADGRAHVLSLRALVDRDDARRASTTYTLLLLFVLLSAGLAVGMLRLVRRRMSDLQLAATVFNASPEGIAITDSQTRILRTNPAFTRISGYADADVIGQTPRLLSSGRQSAQFYEGMWNAINRLGHWSGEIWNRRKNGEIYPEWLSINSVRDAAGAVTHYVGVFTDLTHRRRDEERIRFLAYHDALTGLPNRLLLRDRVDQALLRAARGDTRFAVMLLDLDNFKNVNDTLGHSAGDAVLMSVVERVGRVFRETDTLSRLGGDEFVFVPTDVTGAADAERLAAKLLAQLAQPFKYNDQLLSVTGSVGIALYPEDGTDFDTLLRQADGAMYLAKQQGRNGWSFPSRETNQRMIENLNVHAHLARALENGEIHVHYQPRVDMDTGRVLGMEALARWTSPELGDVPPARFIPIAESSGLIVALGASVLSAACRQARHWDAWETVVSVNISAIQFRRIDQLFETIEEALRESGLAPQRLELELTESVLIGNAEQAMETLQRLKRLGVRIAIDDFGTGYSSLAYLTRFDIDVLKIDQSFVRDIEYDADDLAIVLAVVHLARSLKLDVVAEGIETSAQLEILRNCGCTFGQGFYFLPPQPAAQATHFIAHANGNAPLPVESDPRAQPHGVGGGTSPFRS
jgi:diguanylate cyclase (GGDEF)-like protein/PAS domain S-box-containing protein